MLVFITSDSDWEVKVGNTVDRLYDTGYKHFFNGQNYGGDLNGVSIVLLCHEVELNLKRRIRLSKGEKILEMDVLLNHEYFIKIEQKEREKIIVEKLITEVPQIISKYKFKDFDLSKFEKDLKRWMSKIL